LCSHEITSWCTCMSMLNQCNQWLINDWKFWGLLIIHWLSLGSSRKNPHTPMDGFLEIYSGWRDQKTMVLNPGGRRGWTQKRLLRWSFPTERNLKLLDVWHVTLEHSLNLKKVEIFQLYLSFLIYLKPRGVLPEKLGGGCAARLPKPLPYLWPKSAIFPTLFMAWPKIWNPIYDLTLKSKLFFRPTL